MQLKNENGTNNKSKINELKYVKVVISKIDNNNNYKINVVK